ncbi:MAG TPA: DNA mismatch endonuclease Vsr [Candidatus Angelobacter sp.]
MDMFSANVRSQIMSRIRSRRNESTELRLIHIMRRNGITGWRRNSCLLGKPDFVFPLKRIAVFVDGDFWHGNPRRFRMPATNRKYWRAKIARNKQRDRRVARRLRRDGWCVIRIWESQLRDEDAVVRKLRFKLQ